jgi:hypothetical protein
MSGVSAPPDVQPSPPPPLASVADAVGPDGRIQVDLPCRRCGYNLHSLDRRATCPECNLAVRLSLRLGDFAYCEPAYVRCLSIGAHLLLIGAMIALGSLVFMPFHGKSLSLLCFAAAFVAVTGTWLITAADPGGFGEAEVGMRRRIPRVLLTIALIAFPLNSWRLATTSAPAAAVAHFLATLCCVAGFLGALALTRYLQDVGQRLGNAVVMLQMRTAFRGIAVGVPGFCAMAWLLWRYGRLQPVVALPFAVLGTAIVLYAQFAVFASVASLWTLARALAAEARMARQLWPAAESQRVLPDRFE